MPNKSPLFAEFPSIDRAEWMAKIEKDLKGKAMETLNWEPEPGLKVPPLFHRSDAKASSWLSDQRSANHWEIGQRIELGDLKETNQRILSSLAGGANALEFQLDSTLTEKELNILLKDVVPAYISLHFSWTGDEFPVLNYWEALQSFLEGHKGVGSWRGSLQWTPPLTADNLQIATQLIESTASSSVQLLQVKNEAATNSSVAEGLAHLVGRGQAFIAQLQELGVTAEASADRIHFAVTTDNAFFVEIAKIRALKLLWANVLKAYELAPSPIHITAYTAAPTTGDDPYRFMIQSATQAMSAVIGGANRLFVTAADHGNSTDDSRFTDNPDFGPRIARNVQHLLQLESFMDRVIDPGSGSYYIEHLTRQLATQAWEIFQERAV